MFASTPKMTSQSFHDSGERKGLKRGLAAGLTLRATRDVMNRDPLMAAGQVVGLAALSNLPTRRQL